METNEINAVNAVQNYQPNRETGAEQPERSEQIETNSQKEAYQVELSETAREQRDFIEAERAKANLEDAQNSTYNASAKIGG
jgi:hypothetical protein